MNPFTNANSRVQRHSFGIKEVSEYTHMSNGVATHGYLEQKALKDHATAVTESTTIFEKEALEREAVGKVQQQLIMESQITGLSNKVYRDGKLEVFKDILFEMFAKSLYLDEEFIIAQENNLRSVINEYVDSNGGFTILEKAYSRTKSPLLKKVIGVCEATSSKVSSRKMTEAKDGNADLESFKFTLNTEEKEQLNYEKEKLGIDELSMLVKKKVLTVIKDEKSRQRKEEELYQDLENQATDEGKTVQESLRHTILGHIPVEESTIFNSLFRHSYKDILEGSHTSAASADESEDDEDHRMNQVNTDMDDLMNNPVSSDDDEYSLAKEMDGYQTEDSSVNDEEQSIDMDLILAESITKYTLLELAYTIKLEDYGYEDLRKISQKLLN